MWIIFFMLVLKAQPCAKSCLSTESKASTVGVRG